MQVEFLSHKNHNPYCDIISTPLCPDSYLTYYIVLSGEGAGNEGCEYYRGQNYSVNSRAKSYSRHWPMNKVPNKYQAMVQQLKEIYRSQYA